MLRALEIFVEDFHLRFLPDFGKEVRCQLSDFLLGEVVLDARSHLVECDFLGGDVLGELDDVYCSMC